MDANLADWYRAAELTPNHETMVSRQAVITDFAKNCTSKHIIDLGHCFFGLAVANETVLAMQAAIHEADNAFAMKDNEIELRVLAGACLMSLLKGANGIRSALGLTCPSLLGKRESLLVPEICLSASRFLDATSQCLRSPEGLTTKRASATKIEKETAGITDATAGNAFSTAAPHITSALESLHLTLSNLVAKCNKLERNQQLFREDSDILWWMTGGHSRELDVPFADINQLGVAALLGKELADLTHVLPGPFAVQGVLGRCLQQCEIDSKSISLSQLVNKTPDELKQRWICELNGRDALLRLCPVACAVSTSIDIVGERKWQAPFEAAASVKATVKFTPLDWAYQTYRECILIRIMHDE